jgi:single-strand DNA-binding protein
MLNKIIIMGRLTADVELRATQSGKNVASFTVAVDRDFKGPNGEKETDFINCVAWQGTADFVSKYFQKSSMAVVAGRLQTRRYETSDGQKRTATEVIAENVYFGESKKETANNAPTTPPADFDNFVPIDDEDLPF